MTLNFLGEEGVERLASRIKNNTNNIESLDIKKVEQLDLELEVKNQLDGVKADIITQIIAQLGGIPVFGTVNDDNTITVTSMLADGDYVLMYENDNGTLEEIGTITVSNGEATGGEGYTNIIDTFGYSDGYRISTSTGALSAQDGYTTTGLMTIPSGSIIRTKWVNFNYNSNYCNIGVYDASGNKISTNNLIGQGTEVWNGLTWSFDSEGNLLMNYEISTGEAIYIKISGYGSGENLIVTINEEIPTGYTNVIDTVGYTDGIRISTSTAGTTKNADGFVTTGIINLASASKPVTIRTKGVDFSNAQSAVTTYNSSGTATYGLLVSGLVSDVSDIITAELDENNNLTLVISANASDSYSQIQLCGYGSGADLIVTINEVIV